MDATLRPGDAFIPGSDADESVLYPESHYKTRGRTPPSQRDLAARLKSPSRGQHGPKCICEMCSCGKHACPVHGRKKTPFHGDSTYGQAFKVQDPSGFPEPVQRVEPKKERPTTRFVGESTHTHGFPPPPADAYRSVFQETNRVERERSKTPPKTLGGRAKFEGSSAYRRDYNPPPKDAFQSTSKENSDIKIRLQQPSRKDGRAPFEGVSSSHRDFKPPPPEALRRQQKQPADVASRGLVMKENVRQGAQFDGSSQMRRDFLAPPRDAYGKKENVEVAEGVVVKTANPSAKRRFEGESQTRRDFIPPPKDAYDAKVNTEALIAERNLGPGTGGRPNPKFDGLSTSQKNFAPPPRDAYRGGSDAGRDRTPTKRDRPNTRFEGTSTSMSHYTLPPRDAYVNGNSCASFDDRPKKSTNKIQDTRDFTSTSARGYGPPASQPRCRASLLLAEGPPTPGSGRNHVYYDQSSKSWY